MDAQIYPVFYRTSSPLGSLPCLLPNCHHYVDGQGKGTADHLLPLGDWLKHSKQLRIFRVVVAWGKNWVLVYTVSFLREALTDHNRAVTPGGMVECMDG